MSVITIQQCPACRKNKEEIHRDKWKPAADPNCPKCKGSGHNEVDKEKRLAMDREIDDMLDKCDVMEDAGLSWDEIDSMSDEEFEKWTRASLTNRAKPVEPDPPKDPPKDYKEALKELLDLWGTQRIKRINKTKYLEKHFGGKWKYDYRASWWCDDDIRSVSRTATCMCDDYCSCPVQYLLHGLHGDGKVKEVTWWNGE